MTAGSTPITDWDVETLAEHHDCSALNSGREKIDTWFHDHALRLQREGLTRTYVWVDQDPYVGGFFSLRPHRFDNEDAAEIRMQGHAGGSVSGYLLAKIGIAAPVASKTSVVSVGDTDETVTLKNVELLVVMAVVKARMAAQFGGGAYLFVDTSNEPPPVTDALVVAGFRSVRPSGDDSMYFIKLDRNTKR